MVLKSAMSSSPLRRVPNVQLLLFGLLMTLAARETEGEALQAQTLYFDESWEILNRFPPGHCLPSCAVACISVGARWQFTCQGGNSIYRNGEIVAGRRDTYTIPSGHKSHTGAYTCRSASGVVLSKCVCLAVGEKLPICRPTPLMLPQYAPRERENMANRTIKAFVGDTVMLDCSFRPLLPCHLRWCDAYLENSTGHEVNLTTFTTGSELYKKVLFPMRIKSILDGGRYSCFADAHNFRPSRRVHYNIEVVQDRRPERMEQPWLMKTFKFVWRSLTAAQLHHRRVLGYQLNLNISHSQNTRTQKILRLRPKPFGFHLDVRRVLQPFEACYLTGIMNFSVQARTSDGLGPESEVGQNSVRMLSTSAYDVIVTMELWAIEACPRSYFPSGTIELADLHRRAMASLTDVLHHRCPCCHVNRHVTSTVCPDGQATNVAVACNSSHPAVGLRLRIHMRVNSTFIDVEDLIKTKVMKARVVDFPLLWRFKSTRPCVTGEPHKTDHETHCELGASSTCTVSNEQDIFPTG